MQVPGGSGFASMGIQNQAQMRFGPFKVIPAEQWDVNFSHRGAGFRALLKFKLHHRGRISRPAEERIDLVTTVPP